MHLQEGADAPNFLRYSSCLETWIATDYSPTPSESPFSSD
jgi:hypothetical protein